VQVRMEAERKAVRVRTGGRVGGVLSPSASAVPARAARPYHPLQARPLELSRIRRGAAGRGRRDGGKGAGVRPSGPSQTRIRTACFPSLPHRRGQTRVGNVMRQGCASPLFALASPLGPVISLPCHSG
jgi:hypothetical protein